MKKFFILILILVLIVLTGLLFKKEENLSYTTYENIKKESNLDYEIIKNNPNLPMKENNTLKTQIEKVIPNTVKAESGLIVCVPEKRNDCENGICNISTPSVSVIIDIPNKKIGRCDTNGCDKYPARIEESGIYINAEPDSLKSWFVKISTITNEYIEVAAVGLSTINSYGKCTLY